MSDLPPFVPVAMRAANALRTLGVRLVRPVRLGARIVAVRDDGWLLYVRHSYMKGWYFPGGAVDQGETAEQAAVRELWEETGLRPTGPVASLGLQFAQVRGVSDHVAVFAAPVSGTPEARGWEIAEVRFAPPDRPPDALNPSMAEQLQRYRDHLER